MSSKYHIVDADTHVLEPPDMWERYIDPKFRERAPRIHVNSDGDEILRTEDNSVGDEADRGFEKGIGHIGAFGAVFGQGELDLGAKYQDTKGGYDPHARIAHMNKERIDATVLFPSLGLTLGQFRDPALGAACYRAYNRWLHDFCRPYPDRLFGAAMLPMQSIELAVEELRYARKELGMRVAFIRPQPYNGRALHDPAYDPIWTEAQELDVTIAVHSGTSFDMPALGRDRFPSLMTGHIVIHTWEGMGAMLSIVFCGIASRYPKLRFGFYECGGGWVPGWLDRMDRHYEKVYKEFVLREKPSALFRQQCWVTFDPAEGALPYVAEYMGVTQILFATDYPHPDGAPDGVARIERHPKLSDPTKRKILADNAVRFYKL